MNQLNGVAGATRGGGIDRAVPNSPAHRLLSLRASIAGYIKPECGINNAGSMRSGRVAI